MAERSDIFWLERENKLRKFEASWYQEIKDKDKVKKDYSMSGALDGDLEKVVGNRLLLAGTAIL